ncbi:hypothetical protein [uncultured Maricaulis sp.]|uniref:hypothetical protein n=1 Tax=uncultured Maricaulis sp. TaxID=174710 RepID=UPI00263A1B06|nr:hypothetical protein [uncultured Maricaulis sp.]
MAASRCAEIGSVSIATPAFFSLYQASTQDSRIASKLSGGVGVWTGGGVGGVIAVSLLVRIWWVAAALATQRGKLAHGGVGRGQARGLGRITAEEFNVDLPAAAFHRGLVERGQLRCRQGAQIIDALSHMRLGEVIVRSDLAHLHSVQEHQIGGVYVHRVAAASSGFSSHAEQ